MLVCCSVGMCWCAVVLKCVEMCVDVLVPLVPWKL